MLQRTVLVVDDSRTIAAILREALEGEGYRVRCVCSGEEALAHLEAETPDLIILDVLMPKMSGLEVLARIKAAPKTAPIHVIMLTASGRHEDILQGYKLGAEYYITKPFKQTELLHGIQLVLGQPKQTAA
ncbi:MAG TPA: response regulator [Candidatus Binatia bacterium]